MNREQAAAEIKARYAEYLTPAKVKNTYICPLCGNGTGSTGDGLTHAHMPRGVCFNCAIYEHTVNYAKTCNYFCKTYCILHEIM